MMTARMSERVCSVPATSFSAPTVNACPAGSSTFCVRIPATLPPWARIPTTRMRPFTSIPCSTRSCFSRAVSGISPTFSSAIISTDLAPASFAATAQSSAVAPPPTTATFLPRTPKLFGFFRKSIPPIASSLFGMFRMIGSHRPAATITALYPFFSSVLGSVIFRPVLSWMRPPPIPRQNATSFSSISLYRRCSGISRHMPPPLSFCSKISTL